MFTTHFTCKAGFFGIEGHVHQLVPFERPFKNEASPALLVVVLDFGCSLLKSNLFRKDYSAI